MTWQEFVEAVTVLWKPDWIQRVEAAEKLWTEAGDIEPEKILECDGDFNFSGEMSRNLKK